MEKLIEKLGTGTYDNGLLRNAELKHKALSQFVRFVVVQDSTDIEHDIVVGSFDFGTSAFALEYLLSNSRLLNSLCLYDTAHRRVGSVSIKKEELDAAFAEYKERHKPSPLPQLVTLTFIGWSGLVCDPNVAQQVRAVAERMVRAQQNDVWETLETDGGMFDVNVYHKEYSDDDEMVRVVIYPLREVGDEMVRVDECEVGRATIKIGEE